MDLASRRPRRKLTVRSRAGTGLLTALAIAAACARRSRAMGCPRLSSPGVPLSAGA